MKPVSANSARPHPKWREGIGPNVLMIGAVSLLTDASSEMIYPLLPVFLAGLVPLGSAAVYVGLMAGISETTASLLKIFSGRISDALGRRKLLVVLGYGLSTVFRPLIAVATAGWHVIAFRFADRVGKGIRTSPRDALISYSVEPEFRGRAFGLHRAMDHFGAVAGPIIAAVILLAFLGRGLWIHSEQIPTQQEMQALRWLFGLALIPGLVAMVVLMTKVREVLPAATEPTDGKSKENLSAWRRLPKKFYIFVGIASLFALGNSSDLFLLLLAKTKFGLDMMSLLGMWVALHLSKVICSFFGGSLSDRLGRRPVIVAGWLVYALVYLGLAVVGQQWQFWCLLIIYGLYYGLTEGVEKALVADLAPLEYRGSAYGVYHGAIGLAALPASLLFGVFWKVLGAPIAFGVGAGLACLAAILLSAFLATESRS
ncbi:MAG: MFS transporter [Actinobacteria bacterium]|nr:MFS transporter [Actinomycetota bacterium]